MNERVLYASLILSMSMEEAKAVLGFPPGASPSPGEISKAYKRKAIENHPDRGGDPVTMVEINVAKDILEGKRGPDRTPVRPPAEDPSKVQRQKVDRAVEEINKAEKEVSSAIESCLSATDLGRGRVNVRKFLIEDFTDVLHTIQDVIDDSTPSADMQKADALCVSLTNKASRFGKRYLAFVKLHGEVSAGLIGLGGADPITYASMTKLFDETTKFIGAFNDLYQESRKLMGLIRTSENVPLDWDDLLHKPHSILDSFVSDWKGFNDQPLKRLRSALDSAMDTVRKALVSVGNQDWGGAPKGLEDFEFPQSFNWARETAKGSRPKDKMAQRVATRFSSS